MYLYGEIATWIAPDFEVLKNKEPSLFISSWCEMIYPSSKWRRNVYKSNKKTGRKCDGILFDNNSKIERLVFENVCSPGKTKPPKYHRYVKRLDSLKKLNYFLTSRILKNFRDHFVTRLILFVRDSGLTDKGMQKYLGNISY